MLETFAFATAEEIGDGNMHMVKDEFGGLDTFVAKLIKGATGTHARCTLFDEEDTHAAMRRVNLRVRAGQHSKDAATLSVCNPQLAAIQNVVVPLAGTKVLFACGCHRNGLDVAACVGFGEADAAALLAFGHDGEETLTLILCAVGLNHVGDQNVGVNDATQTHPAAR